jgi:hypothetical protein
LPSLVNPQVSPGLEAVIRKALEKDRTNQGLPRPNAQNVNRGKG